MWYVDLISVSFWNFYNSPTITNKLFQKRSIYIQRIFTKFYRIESFVMNKKRYATYDIYNYNRTYFQLTSNFDSLVIGRRSPATWHRSPQSRIRDLIILFRKCDGWCLWINLSCRLTWHYSRFVHRRHLMRCYTRERDVAMIRGKKKKKNEKKKMRRKRKKEEEEEQKWRQVTRLEHLITHSLVNTKHAARYVFNLKEKSPLSLTESDLIPEWDK